MRFSVPAPGRSTAGAGGLASALRRKSSMQPRTARRLEEQAVSDDWVGSRRARGGQGRPSPPLGFHHQVHRAQADDDNPAYLAQRKRSSKACEWRACPRGTRKNFIERDFRAEAIECRLSRGLRSYSRRPLKAHYPPEGEVPGLKNVGSLTNLSGPLRSAL